MINQSLCSLFRVFLFIVFVSFFFFNDTATTEIYTLSLHDALPIQEHDKGRHVEQHQPYVQALEGRGVLGALGQRDERGQHDQHAGDDDERHGVALHDVSTHSYQALVRSQPLNSEAMSCSGPGKSLTSSTARMRIL